MDKSFKIKFVIGFVFVILLLLGGYFLYSNNRKEKAKEESFKFYNNYNFVENDVKKSDLISDVYLLNLISLDSYSSFDENNLEKLMVYYVKNITRNTATDMKTSKKSLSFNLSKKAFIDSMKELFNVDITDIYDKFDDVSFITIAADRVYFNVDYSLISNDDGYFLGIKSISNNNGVTTINTYIYSFMVDSEETENNLKESLINSVNANDFVEFNKLIENYGTYIDKTISFKEIPNGDFFKYQVLSIQVN